MKFAQIGYIQPNIPGHNLSQFYGKYISANESQNNFQTTIDLTRDLIKNSTKLDLIIWPEIPQGFPYYQEMSIQKAIDETIKQANGAPILFYSRYPYNNHPNIPSQSAIHLAEDNYQISRPYYKANLIPFSEYLPGKDYFPWLRNIFPKVGNTIPGKITKPIAIGNSIQLVPLICYDGIFHNFVRKFASDKGNILVSLDNNINFGPTRAQEVHFSVIYYRAIENRTPLLRVTNSGGTKAVTSSGRIITSSKTPNFQKAYRASRLLPKNSGQTIYQKGGYFSPWILTLLLVFDI